MSGNPNRARPKSSAAAASAKSSSVVVVPSLRTAATTTTDSHGVTTTTVIANQPSRKRKAGERIFVGGAQAARQAAVANQRRRTRIVTPMERERLSTVLPMNMNPMERFAAALLRTSPEDFMGQKPPPKDHNSGGKRQKQFPSSPERKQQQVAVWSTICARVGLTIPKGRLQARYDSARVHFGLRAALVLEESRHAIHEGLGNRARQASRVRHHSGKSNKNCPPLLHDSIVVICSNIEKANSHGHSRITLSACKPTAAASKPSHNNHRKHHTFTRDQLFSFRPGTVFQCVPREEMDVRETNTNDKGKRSDFGSNKPKSPTARVLMLGMMTSGNREGIERDGRFTLLICRPLPDRVEGKEWVVTPIATLISEIRCFEALTTAKPETKIPFLDHLLGAKPAVHTRFDGENEKEATANDGKPAARARRKSPVCDVEDEESTGTQQEDSIFRLPILNESQQRAADAFLFSPNRTITLCQGPPGTGKTTLLISIITRYLLDANGMNNKVKSVSDKEAPSGVKKCLLVCAPTNKAVSVLAKRLVESTNVEHSPFNVLLVGDAEKLLADEGEQSLNMPSKDKSKCDKSLRSIFIYSFVPKLIEDYRQIQKYLESENRKKPNSQSHGRFSSIEELVAFALELEARIGNHLFEQEELWWEASHVRTNLEARLTGGQSNALPKVHRVISLLDDLQSSPDSVWKQLVANADVIFCTLASAGAHVFKNHKIDDLIVDEAAAATEPELYIPFHMAPSRLLCVGDPLQLPATVLSPRACELGMAESLHERLMFRCDVPYELLSIQYRMNPSISAFPSHRFYDSKIEDGGNVKDRSLTAGPLLDGRPYLFVNVQGREEQAPGGSYRNFAEARCVVDLVLQLRKNSSSITWNSADQLRIITFYQGQCSLLKRFLREVNLDRTVVVATVDSSQGCEADVVLASFVRSPPPKTKNARAGFLTDDRRMNVALTRARIQLICVGNVDGLGRMVDGETLQLLSADAKDRDIVVHPDGSPYRFDGKRNRSKDSQHMQIPDSRAKKAPKLEQGTPPVLDQSTENDAPEDVVMEEVNFKHEKCDSRRKKRSKVPRNAPATIHKVKVKNESEIVDEVDRSRWKETSRARNNSHVMPCETLEASKSGEPNVADLIDNFPAVAAVESSGAAGDPDDNDEEIDQENQECGEPSEVENFLRNRTSVKVERQVEELSATANGFGNKHSEKSRSKLQQPHRPLSVKSEPGGCLQSPENPSSEQSLTLKLSSSQPQLEDVADVSSQQEAWTCRLEELPTQDSDGTNSDELPSHHSQQNRTEASIKSESLQQYQENEIHAGTRHPGESSQQHLPRNTGNSVDKRETQTQSTARRLGIVKRELGATVEEQQQPNRLEMVPTSQKKLPEAETAANVEASHSQEFSEESKDGIFSQQQETKQRRASSACQSMDEREGNLENQTKEVERPPKRMAKPTVLRGVDGNRLEVNVESQTSKAPRLQQADIVISHGSENGRDEYNPDSPDDAEAQSFDHQPVDNSKHFSESEAPMEEAIPYRHPSLWNPESSSQSSSRETCQVAVKEEPNENISVAPLSLSRSTVKAEPEVAASSLSGENEQVTRRRPQQDPPGFKSEPTEDSPNLRVVKRERHDSDSFNV